MTDVLIDASSPAAPTGAIEAGGGQRAQAATSAAAAAPVGCTYKIDARPQRRVSVIELHNATNSNVSWSYGKKADSSIDIGYNLPGQGWKIGGSYKVSNNAGAEVGGTIKERLNAYVRTDFLWADGHYTHPTAPNGTWCFYGPANPVYQVGSKRRDATEWVGGAGINKTLPGAEYLGCDTGTRPQHRIGVRVGHYFSRYTENAAKISGAVDLGPLSVGADSGYSSNVGMRWDSKRGNGIWLCGTNYPPPTAGVVHAQNRP